MIDENTLVIVSDCEVDINENDCINEIIENIKGGILND